MSLCEFRVLCVLDSLSLISEMKTRDHYYTQSPYSDGDTTRLMVLVQFELRTKEYAEGLGWLQPRVVSTLGN